MPDKKTKATRQDKWGDNRRVFARLKIKSSAPPKLSGTEGFDNNRKKLRETSNYEILPAGSIVYVTSLAV